MYWHILIKEYSDIFCMVEEAVMMEGYMNASKCPILELASANATLELSASFQFCVGKFLQPAFMDESYDVI